MSNALKVLKVARPATFVTPDMVGREDKRTNNRTMLSTLKIDGAARYQGPVKIELLKGAGLLFKVALPFRGVQFTK